MRKWGRDGLKERCHAPSVSSVDPPHAPRLPDQLACPSMQVYVAVLASEGELRILGDG